jgi:hypothetical protein
MIDKKKIIKINAGSREDYRQYIYIVPKQTDVLKVRDFILKLREKYSDNYDSYEAEK